MHLPGLPLTSLQGPRLRFLLWPVSQMAISASIRPSHCLASQPWELTAGCQSELPGFISLTVIVGGLAVGWLIQAPCEGTKSLALEL